MSQDPRRRVTSSGIELPEFYAARTAGPGEPGEFPLTRGVHPDMYRGRLWTMRQYAGYGSAAESNARFHYLIAQGVKGLSVAFDLPTQMGLDPDHPLAAGEVGRAGVSIASLADMEELFEGIRLDQVSTSMTINSTAAILLALYVAVARKTGADVGRLAGTVQNDILKEYAARGTHIYPPRGSMRLVTDLMVWAHQHLPEWNPISISGYHFREAGATAVQEVAFTLGNAIAYVEAAVRAGLEVDSFAPRLSFFFNAHGHLLEEVAKFRGARRLWARLMRDRFGARHPRSWALRFHVQTAGSTLTAQQPDINVVRTALEALAAVLGGAQSLHTNARDEALALPTEEAVRLALRTQQVIAHESGVTHTVDPVGGSYAIEALTDEIETRAAEGIRRLDEMGGMVAAIERGYVQNEIHRAAYEHQRQVESGERVIVGVNRYRLPAEAPVPVLEIDPALEAARLERLRQLRAARDNSRTARALEAVERAAASEANLVAPILEAVESHATLGEISDRMRRVFGEYREAA